MFGQKGSERQANLLNVGQTFEENTTLAEVVQLGQQLIVVA